jgi:hypothetical protein
MFTYRRLITLLGFVVLSFLFLITSTIALARLSFSKTHVSLPPQGGGTGAAQWECWDDDSLDPCHPDIYGVDSITPNNIWAVGEAGGVFRYDGTDWNKVRFLNEQYTLYDVEVVAANSVWAVAAGLYHWDGTDWEEIAPGNRASLALSMLSDTDGWAVGYSGDIRHWDGTQFITITSPITTPLRDIQMISATDGWAVGDNGAILWYDGAAWSTFASPTTQGLTTVQMVSATEGYAIGNNVFLPWNGTNWTIAATPSGFFSSLAMVSATEGYADSYEGIYVWDGVAWTLDYTGTDAYLDNMTLLSDGQIVAVGNAGTIFRHNSGGWSADNAPFSKILNAVAAISSTDVWAVGYEEVLLHYNGTTWQEGTFTSLPTPVSNRAFFDIAFWSASDGWIVGSDVILRWDGTGWQEVDDNSSEYRGYRGVEVVSETDVWVVGELSGGAGSVIRHWNGTSWSNVPHPSATRLNTITMLDSNTGMAGGYRYDSGTGAYTSVLLRWNGTIWSELSTPNIGDIAAIVLQGANNGWMVSSGGGLRLTEGTFATENVYGNSIAFTAPTNGWVVGTYGYRWDGTQWNYDQYFPQYISDLVLFEDKTGWAVGDNGVLYSFAPPLTLYVPLIQRAE